MTRSPIATDPAAGASVKPAEFLRLLLPHGAVVEIRAPNCPDKPGGAFKPTASAYCDNAETAGKLAKAIDNKQPVGTYVTINPVNPALLARSANCIDWRAKTLTGDVNILRRANLFIDVDSVRPAGISATDEEMESALTLARRIASELAYEGWPEPIIGMSGNGGYLFYSIDLPNDAAGTDLIRRVLVGMGERFDTAAAKIDRGTFNASRIAKILGTTARKGSDFKGSESNPARPWRQSWYEPPAGELAIVPRELLESVASEIKPAPATVGPATSTNGNASHNGSGKSPFDRCLTYHDKMPDAISGQGGHGATLAAACECYRFGLADDQATAAMQRFNATKTGGEPWTDRDLEHKLRDARAKVEAAGEFGCRMNDRWKEGNGTAPTPRTIAKAENEPGPTVYRRLTCAELAGAEYKTEYWIEGTLVACQPCIFAGGKKALKTSVAADAMISLATCSPFLGRLRVERSVRGAFFSGETGEATLQETALRICAAKAISLDEIQNLVWSPDLPVASHLSHETALRKFLRDDEIEAVCVDPAYLALSGADAGNLFIQGAMLRRMTEVCSEAGATLILIHHTRKGIVDPFQPPELEDLAWAGFQEFARQWILVGRRERYEPGTGEHRLWLNVGGSAGHSSLWALDVHEGVYDGHTPRRWEVELLPATEARDDARQRQEAAKIEKQQTRNRSQLEADKAAIIRAAGMTLDGDTKSGLRDRSGVRSDRFSAALAELLAEGSLITTDVFKGKNQRYEGFRLKPDFEGLGTLGHTRTQHPDNLSDRG